MTRVVRAVLVAATLLQPITAWAETTGGQTAKTVEEAVRTYGPDAWSKPGLLSVAPDAEGFRMNLDIAKAIEDGIAPWTIRDATPLAFKLKERPDGRWSFDASGPFRLTAEFLAANRSNTVSLAAASKVIRGVFDPAVVFPRETEIGLTDAVLALRAAQDSIKIGVKDYRLTSTTKDLPEGIADVEADFSMQDVSATLGAFPKPEVRIAAARIDGTYKAGKLDLAGIAAITRFWQVTADGKDVSELTDAERTQLRIILGKHIPVLDEIGGTLTATGLSISEAGKGFTMEKLDYQSRWEGMGGKAALVIGARAENVGVGQDVWPKGLAEVLPKEAAFNLKVSGFDMTAVWKDASLLRTEQEIALLPRDHFSKTVLPGGRVVMDLADSHVRSSFYDLTISGRAELAVGEREQLSGSFKVTARDLDGTVKYLQDNAGAVPAFNKFAVVALMMKGLGTQGPDGATVWDVRFEDMGKITVNGQPLPL